MNWLNRLDDVLDKALTPQNSRHGDSSSARRGQQSPSNEILADQFGNESDSSHGSPVIRPSRSLDTAGPSIPGRVRRRSEGVAVPASKNDIKPALGNPPLPVFPGQLKRNSSSEVTNKTKQYPGNVKRRMIPKGLAEESQQSPDSESELPSKLQQSISTKANEAEIQHSGNSLISNETVTGFNQIESVKSDASVSADRQSVTGTVHDEKQNEHLKLQHGIDNELSGKLLQSDRSPTQSSKASIVESLGSLAKTKALSFFQANRSDDKAREPDSRGKEASLGEASELALADHSDRVKTDTNEAVTLAKTKLDKDRELLTRNENRGENGGIVVALFSEIMPEMRLEPPPDDNNGSSDVQKDHDAHKVLQPQFLGDNHESAVEESFAHVHEAGEPVADLPLYDSKSKHSVRSDNDKGSAIESRLHFSSILDDTNFPVKDFAHQDISVTALSAQRERITEHTSATLRDVTATHERSHSRLEEQATKAAAGSDSLERRILLNGESSASIHDRLDHGHASEGEWIRQHEDDDNSSGDHEYVIDSPSTPKAPAARNESRTASEGGIDSPHRSASLTKSDVDGDSTISIWSNFKLDIPFDRSRNRHGMVSLRLLRARRLSCSIGSFVHGSISLKPWKGKYERKLPERILFLREGMVYVQYGMIAKKNRVSMIHAFSSDESPIPTIEIDLTASPLGMGLLGFTMGTLSLSCEDLLMNPYRVCRYWLSIPETTPILGASRLASPMVQVEVMFEPTTVEEDIIEGDNILPPETIDIPEDVHIFHSADRGGTRADDIVSSTPFSVKTTPFSAKSQRSIHSQTNQHLLRLKRFRLPATCCVCKRSIMSGIRAQPAYRCEKCKIDCCEDCTLQVDIKVPCGSFIAQEELKNSIQNKLSMSTILNTVAPVSGTATSTAQDHNYSSSKKASVSTPKGIGKIDLVFLRAFVLDEPWSPESDAADILADAKTSFKSGDYYMRITKVGSRDSARTQTIQNSSKPVFDSKELILNVPHYGCEFRIDLVDALTDKPVGSSLITTQSLLQLQRDDILREGAFQIFSIFGLKRKIPNKIQLRIDLRHDMKDATTFEYFSPPNPSPHSSQLQRGDIVGYTDILISMKEDLDSLYGDNPYECPPRPPDELNMRLFQLHMTRLSNLIEATKGAVNGYIYVISWKNPIVTALSLFISLQICATFNPAFIGSLPCFCVIIFMVTSALRHVCFQTQRDVYVRREIEKRRKEENIVLEHAVHRPVGEIGIAISAGRNISSLEFGIPGSVMCRALWNPEGLMSSTEKEKKEIRPVVHEIGSTDRVYSANPVWKEAKESSLTKRLRSIKHFNRESVQQVGSVDAPQFIFPVLQPVNTHDMGLPVLEPWVSSLGTIDVEIGFTDVISILPDSESIAGVISVPFVDVYNHKEIKGWFKPNQPGKENTLCKAQSEDDGTPQVYLKIWWMPPVDDEESGIDKESDTRREESVFIQEEMIRSTIIQGESRRGVIGSSLGAISSVRGLTGHLAVVQNTLGQVLDIVEAVCNALTFTDPMKSTILLGIVISLWIFFSLISVKIMLYAIVMGQYGATFVGRFGSLFSKKSETAQTKKQPRPVGIWVMNAFRGIPTFEDLRRTYFWESLRRGREKTKDAFRARWYSSIQIQSTSGDRWRTCFAIIQGHRFTWWSSVNDFDEGGKPLGSIFLSGHSGLATPSPLELKQLPSESLDRLVCLFGRGVDKQERLSLLTPSSAGKVELELAINHTISHKAE